MQVLKAAALKEHSNVEIYKALQSLTKHLEFYLGRGVGSVTDDVLESMLDNVEAVAESLKEDVELAKFIK